ncbi:zinc-binding alcohol dehydrogenase family protein [Candidatus Berkiella aquae]|uniref:Zinc-type alcohol dehydrogenase-like protein n=1 Tax=Candidatus Berkiella aquae TaxID=295108 RepID=A0A0Q9YNM3_9GAMM|nr:zinc-binding alcohol dehydrogenase family protein [Candidatus Berkiella aquae]MCS5712402.1 zinc-binding alcohol dehydrogenase family protein [Candidatus Berkiella aquae]
MKALGYYQAHDLKNFNIQELELPIPEPNENEVLVKIKAISVNPVDYKIRLSRNAQNNQPVILGWDAAGTIEKIGSQVQGFQVGDDIFYAGDLLKNGANAEFQVIDYRLVAKKPNNFSFAQAAALPLTSLTAWEALIESNLMPFTEQTKILIIGGGGGVGSIAIQILKATTKVKIIATASREETRQWCQKLGADLVINHQHNLKEELNKQDIKEVDVIFGTTHSKLYLEQIPQILRPFGHFCLIDDPDVLDIVPFKQKSISVHWEFMFTKSMFDYQKETQGKILQKIAALAESGKLISTQNQQMQGLTAHNLYQAHALLEGKTSIGKIIINLDI